MARNLGCCSILYLYARKTEMVNKYAWLLLLLLIVTGCLDEPDCYLLNNNMIGISFKKLEDSSADTFAIKRFGTLEPPLIFSDSTALTKVYLPLNYFQDETAYVFEDADGQQILRLGYISQAQFVSENCGEKFVLSTLRVLEHSFDSVRLVADTPTREGSAINIEIFQ